MFRGLATASLGLLLVGSVVGCESTGAAPSVGNDSTMSRADDQSHVHRTTPFQGPKANTGYAIHWRENGKSVLKVSDDFVIPDTPAPSWQLVDSRGNVYLLNQMKIKGGTNRQITVPAYVNDIAKVQVWCSFAETLLGEAPFESPVK
jgi:hypothetical protein